MENNEEELKKVIKQIEQEEQKKDREKIDIVSINEKIMELICYCLIANFCCNSISMIAFLHYSGSTEPHLFFGYFFVNMLMVILNLFIIGPINVVIVAIHVSIFNKTYTKSICKEKKRLIKWIIILIITISIIGFAINEFIARKMQIWYVVHYYYYLSFVIIALISFISKVNKVYKKVEDQK